MGKKDEVLVFSERDIAETRLNTLKHIRAFIDMNIKAREKEIKEGEKQNGQF